MRPSHQEQPLPSRRIRALPHYIIHNARLRQLLSISESNFPSVINGSISAAIKVAGGSPLRLAFINEMRGLNNEDLRQQSDEILETY